MQPRFEWSREQTFWRFAVRIPVLKGEFDGESVLTQGYITSAVTEGSIKQNRFVAIANWLKDPAITWCGSTDRLLCRFEADGVTLVAVEIASEALCKELRCPVYIQSDEWPLCCGRSMHFVGQIDDNALCTDPPPEAKVWWHDASSFYVFTCAICLECKVIGQQF